MRDWTESVMCKNGHRWSQDIIADPNGQHSLRDEVDRDCPECGMCCVDCDGCESCEPPVDPFIEKIAAICDTFGKVAAEQLERQEKRFGRR